MKYINESDSQVIGDVISKLSTNENKMTRLLNDYRDSLNKVNHIHRSAIEVVTLNEASNDDLEFSVQVNEDLNTDLFTLEAGKNFKTVDQIMESLVESVESIKDLHTAVPSLAYAYSKLRETSITLPSYGDAVTAENFSNYSKKLSEMVEMEDGEINTKQKTITLKTVGMLKEEIDNVVYEFNKLNRKNFKVPTSITEGYHIISEDSKMYHSLQESLKYELNSEDVSGFVNMYNDFSKTMYVANEDTKELQENIILKYLLTEGTYDDFLDDIDDIENDIKEYAKDVKKDDDGKPDTRDKDSKNAVGLIFKSVKKLAAMCKKAISFKSDDIEETMGLRWTLLRIILTLIIMFAAHNILSILFLPIFGILAGLISLIVTASVTISMVNKYLTKSIDIIDSSLKTIEEKINNELDPDAKKNLYRAEARLKREKASTQKLLEKKKKEGKDNDSDTGINW